MYELSSPVGASKTPALCTLFAAGSEPNRAPTPAHYSESLRPGAKPLAFFPHTFTILRLYSQKVREEESGGHMRNAGKGREERKEERAEGTIADGLAGI